MGTERIYEAPICCPFPSVFLRLSVSPWYFGAFALSRLRVSPFRDQAYRRTRRRCHPFPQVETGLSGLIVSDILPGHAQPVLGIMHEGIQAVLGGRVVV